MLGSPKIDKPPPPPYTPRRADAVTQTAEQNPNNGYTSLISTTPSGLQRKSATAKKTLLGGT